MVDIYAYVVNIYSILAVLIFLLIYMFISVYHVGYNILGGFWNADPSFCKETGLDRFYIYFESPEKGNVCWICMANDKNTIINHMTTYKIKTRISHWSSLITNINDSRKYTIIFNELPESLLKNKIFPKSQTLELDINTGKLYLLDDKKVFFVGFKDSRITNLIDIEKKPISVESTMEATMESTDIEDTSVFEMADAVEQSESIVLVNPNDDE